VECVAGYWFAGYFDQVGCSEGPTPLIAAMRAFVASRFGEEIEMPSPPTNEEPGRG